MWQPIRNHPFRGDYKNPPQVLLWVKRYGHALGEVHHWPDGRILTLASGYHGIEFTHYKELDAPID